MSTKKTFEQLKAEAIARGIKPGEVCRSPYATEWTVGPYDRWTIHPSGTMHDCSHEMNPIIWSNMVMEWAEVITPAPEDAQSQDDRIAQLEARIAKLEQQQAVNKADEPWVPKVGDYVMFVPHPIATEAPTKAGCVQRVWDGYKCDVIGYGWDPCTKDAYYNINRLRPATPEEIAAYHKEQEASKPVEFGTWVEYDGDKYRVVHGPDPDGDYIIGSVLDDGYWEYVCVKRDEFTVIDPQP